MTAGAGCEVAHYESEGFYAKKVVLWEINEIKDQGTPDKTH